MLQKAVRLSLLLSSLLSINCATAEENQPAPMLNSNAASKLARINPVFATPHKGCPLHEGEEKLTEGQGEPCPYHAAHQGAAAEHCDHEPRK